MPQLSQAAMPVPWIARDAPLTGTRAVGRHGVVAAWSRRRKTRLRRETGAEAGVSYGIPSEAGPPASFSRRRAHLHSSSVRNPASGVNSSPGGTSAQQARTKPCPCRGKRAHPKGQARQVKRTSAATRSPFGRYALSPSPAAAPAAAAALSAARFLWLRQPVQNTSAIPAAPPTVTPMRTLSTACRP